MEPFTIGFGLAVIILLRGKTADLEPMTDANARDAAMVICDDFGATPGPWQTPEAMARSVGAAAYPDVDWPPRPLAMASHKAVWRQLVQWATDTRAAAGGQGADVCAYLRGGGLIPSIPVVPSPTPSLGGLPELPPAPQPAPGVADVVVVRDVPTPGFYYDLAFEPAGSGLLSLAGRAYGHGPGAARQAAALRINDHPQNAAKRFRPPSGGYEQTVFPSGILSFAPPWQTIYIP